MGVLVKRVDAPERLQMRVHWWSIVSGQDLARKSISGDRPRIIRVMLINFNKVGTTPYISQIMIHLHRIGWVSDVIIDRLG